MGRTLPVGKDMDTYTIRDPHIRAVSFVGSDAAGKHIYSRGTSHGKRVQVSELPRGDAGWHVPFVCMMQQANMGAKNHGIVLPDAEKKHTLLQLAGAAFGAAGQCCCACVRQRSTTLLRPSTATCMGMALPFSQVRGLLHGASSSWWTWDSW